MVHAKVYRCFSICLDWAWFYAKLTFPKKDRICKNGHLKNFMDNCFSKSFSLISTLLKRTYSSGINICRNNIFTNSDINTRRNTAHFNNHG